jgi:predicted AlkP superfamily pyrophosphatase or phosphodiesterase
MVIDCSIRRKNVIRLRAMILVSCCLAFIFPVQASETVREDSDIRLVLQLTVDGLRYDLLSRAQPHLGNGGFRLLLDQGVVYRNAHYRHANTETIVGHATLATGAQPSVHGMTGNVWYYDDAGQLGYNIEDPDSPLLPTREHALKGEQVDPAQRMSRSQGRSPTALLAETFADKLISYSAGRSRAFAISGKDRSAVALAGRGGKAFWMSSDNGDFVTSGWYYETYPAWVRQWNEQRKAAALAGTDWTLLNDKDSYAMKHQDDRPYETDLGGFGRTFPHRFGDAGNKLLHTQVIASPHGDALLADFAAALIRSERLGQGQATDYLSVSFSGIDAINHFFGAASLETEDAVLQLDRALARLFSDLDGEVGLNHVLIVLSADHGAAELPEYMNELGVEAGRLTPDVILELTEQVCEEHFGQNGLARFYYRPYLYLDEERIQDAGFGLDEVREVLARELTAAAGIHVAATRRMLENWPDRELVEMIRNNYHPDRSGDIYIVQEPYWFNFDKGPVVGMHGSPWNYDTHVPIVFAGPNLSARQVQRRVQPADIAPTLAALLGMSPPASSSGAVLTEVFGAPTRRGPSGGD